MGSNLSREAVLWYWGMSFSKIFNFTPQKHTNPIHVYTAETGIMEQQSLLNENVSLDIAENPMKEAVLKSVCKLLHSFCQY